VLIQGSAIGYYGSPVDEPAGESHASGRGFIAELTRDWENAIRPAEDLVRLVTIRTGLVLGKNGGILDKMLLPFRFGTGSILGSGKQWMSWIHMNDMTGAIRFLLEQNNCSGPYNLTTPSPVRMKEFIQTTGKILNRPVLLKVPAFILRTALGKMAEETILASQNIRPVKLLDEGYQFRYTCLSKALENIISPGKP
jgi:uncharacterized protein (TIGR01777 family)